MSDGLRAATGLESRSRLSPSLLNRACLGCLSTAAQAGGSPRSVQGRGSQHGLPFPRARCSLPLAGRSLLRSRSFQSACLPVTCARWSGRSCGPLVPLSPFLRSCAISPDGWPRALFRLIPSLYVGLCRMGESKGAPVAFLTATGLAGGSAPCPLFSPALKRPLPLWRCRSILNVPEARIFRYVPRLTGFPVPKE